MKKGSFRSTPDVARLPCRFNSCTRLYSLIQKVVYCRILTDCSFHANLIATRYQFKTCKANRITCSLWKTSSANPTTVTDSPLVQDLQLLMFFEELAMSFENRTFLSSRKSTNKAHIWKKEKSEIFLKYVRVRNMCESMLARKNNSETVLCAYSHFAATNCNMLQLSILESQ